MRVKSEARRQAILDVAAEVFREHGFEQASMSEITARVGGSKATLYSYFPSKEALFLEVMHQFAEAHMQDVFAELDVAADIRMSLQYFGERFLDFISSARLVSVLRVVYAEAGRSDVGQQFYERGPNEGTRRLKNFFEQCIQKGKLQSCDPEVAAKQFQALLRAECMDPLLMGACALTALPPIKDMAFRAVDVFLKAYGPI